MRLMQNLVLKKINLVLIFEPKGTRPARLDTLVNVSTFFFGGGDALPIPIKNLRSW